MENYTISRRGALNINPELFNVIKSKSVKLTGYEIENPLNITCKGITDTKGNLVVVAQQKMNGLGNKPYFNKCEMYISKEELSNILGTLIN